MKFRFQSLSLPPRFAGALAAAILVTGLAACGSSDDGAPIELTILHVNDHHSRLDAEPTTLRLQNASGAREAVSVELGGFPRVKQAIDEIAATRTNVLKLHAGDAITGDLNRPKSSRPSWATVELMVDRRDARMKQVRAINSSKLLKKA